MSQDPTSSSQPSAAQAFFYSPRGAEVHWDADDKLLWCDYCGNQQAPNDTGSGLMPLWASGLPGRRLV